MDSICTRFWDKYRLKTEACIYLMQTVNAIFRL